MRMIDIREDSQKSETEAKIITELKFTIMIFQLIIVICGFIKILFFIRIYQSFGFLV